MSKEKILIAGGSGLVGQHLASHLHDQGYEICILSRSEKKHPRFTYYQWDIDKKEIDPRAAKVAHIINLTGAGIADKRWTDRRKKEIIDSRVKSTLLLKSLLEKQGVKLKSFCSASAIGIYGDRADELLTEKSSIGKKSFMVDCCEQWEDAASALEDHCDRFCIIRIGIVISSKYKGIINGVSPNALTNKDFIIACKKAIARYALVYPIPNFFMKLIMGEMSAVILNSNRVVPQFLENQKFVFAHPSLEAAVKDVLDKKV